MSTDAIRTGEADAPTTELVTAAVGDRCAKCQSPLAADQRYCLNCGERRGRARFTPEAFTTTTTTVTTVGAPPAPPRQPRLSSAATLVAGVATLLVALGVGVLIGHDSNSAPARSPAAQVITVGGAATASTTASTPSTTTAAKTKSHGKVKPTVVHVTAKTAKAATAAASKVLGSGGNISHNVTQQVGGACSGGAGCQGGKFTGNFFPGG